jgi:hypothetical protein
LTAKAVRRAPSDLADVFGFQEQALVFSDREPADGIVRRLKFCSYIQP